MNASVRSHDIAISHTIFCNKDIFAISLVEELRSPIKCTWSNRPCHSSLIVASVSVSINNLTIFSSTYWISVVNILSNEIYRLIDQLQIFLGNLKQVILKELDSILRIFAKYNRIKEPCNIPCPIALILIKAKVSLLGSLNISW